MTADDDLIRGVCAAGVDVDLDQALQKMGRRAPTAHCLHSCTSTQRVALDLKESEAPHHALVWTRSQTAGRGRGGRSWLSTEDALLFSMVCRPDLPLSQLPRLTLLTGAALLCALRSFDVQAELKWPNDVVIKTLRVHDNAPLGGYRKLAGILVDVSTQGRQLERAVVGVGLNAGSSKGLLDEVAIGIADLSNPPARSDLIFEVLQQLQKWLPESPTDALFAAALDEQRVHSMTLGTEVSVPDEGLVGVAKDLASDGALLVEDAQGKIHRVVAGDVWPFVPQKRYSVDDPSPAAAKNE